MSILLPFGISIPSNLQPAVQIEVWLQTLQQQVQELQKFAAQNLARPLPDLKRNDVMDKTSTSDEYAQKCIPRAQVMAKNYRSAGTWDANLVGPLLILKVIGTTVLVQRLGKKKTQKGL